MINKSSSDHRQYKHLVLDNHLSVLLIEDKNATKAAASMAVNVGHFDDPDDCHGLAHFMEHMLFLGTETYPESDAYMQFISQNNGHHNAWTASEHTNFFFDIHPQLFNDALARFSQFFICPLFNEEYIDKERQAIESEYQLKRKDDVRRLYQVHKETSNKKHPFSRFSVGNLHTLVNKPELSLKQRLHNFFEQHYVATRMTLAITGPIPLAILEQWVKQHFLDIRPGLFNKQAITTPLYLAEHQACHIKMQTLRDTQQIILSFALDSVEQRYKDKSICYYSYLLGHEEKGGLLSYLREQGLVNSLSAGGGIDGSNFKDFNISLMLTKQAVGRIDEICHIVFAYINYLAQQDIQDHIYFEKKQLAELAFQYQEAIKPIDLVSMLSMNMHQYAVEHFVTGDYMMKGLDKPWLQEMLTKLTPQNMRLLQLVSPYIEQDYPYTCLWYEAPYSCQAFSNEFINSLKTAKTKNKFSLPTANPYIAQRMVCLERQDNQKEPEKLIEEPGLNLWFKQDNDFNIPKSHVYLSLDLPNSQGSIKQVALTRVFIEMFMDAISEENYQAESAGINYNIYPHQAGLTIHIAGFSDKQSLLVSKLIEQVSAKKMHENRFDSIKQQIMQSWSNANRGKPVSKLFSLLNSQLQNNQYQMDDMAIELEACTWQQFHTFVEQLFDEVYVECFVFGDCTEKVALNIASAIKAKLLEPNQISQEVDRKVYQLPDNCTWTVPVNFDHNDSSLIVYYQAKTTSSEDAALFMLANQIISPVFFNYLRTEQQLGYMLGTGYMPINQCPGFIAYIQSNTHKPTDLLDAIDHFLEQIPDMIDTIDDESWQGIKTGLLHQVLEPDNSLRVRAQRYWISIGLKDNYFNRRQAIAKNLNEISKAQIKSFISHNLQAKHSRVVMATSNNDEDFKTLVNNKAKINDIYQYHKSSNFILLSDI